MDFLVVLLAYSAKRMMGWGKSIEGWKDVVDIMVWMCWMRDTLAILFLAHILPPVGSVSLYVFPLFALYTISCIMS